MGRPVYETPDDRHSEAFVSALVTDRWRCSLEPMDRFAPVDFAAYRDGARVAFIEHKRRTVSERKYATTLTFVSKHTAALDLQRRFGVPTFLVVSFTDAIRYLDLTTPPAFFAMGGRQDRGDPRDINVCAYYPVASMGVLHASRRA